MYTKANVNIIALIMTSIFFLCLNLLWNYILSTEKSIVYAHEAEVAFITNEVERENTVEENEVDTKVQEENEQLNSETLIGKILIPAFELEAPIAEGTSQEIMNKYVGHFEQTSLWNGNIGLAAHNRGYKVNYFSNVKDLQLGDEIIYETKNGKRTYQVDVITIIEDTDWSYLENTEDNRITLITCVENEPNYRRCIQGIEK